jgi:hypothetical protein
MTRARTPVRATRRVSIRHSSACPRAHKRPASQHAGLRRNPAELLRRAGTGRQGRRSALLAPVALPRGCARGLSVTSLSSAWCYAVCCLLCRSASFQFVGSITHGFIRSISNPWVYRYQTHGLVDQIDIKPMGFEFSGSSSGDSEDDSSTQGLRGSKLDASWMCSGSSSRQTGADNGRGCA